jgi:hypothetical protein
MTEDEKTEGKIVVDEILDGPGDFYYPFSNLRLATVARELRITRELVDEIATATEDPTLSAYQKACVWAGMCAGAIEQLESQLVALRRGRSSGQGS